MRTTAEYYRRLYYTGEGFRLTVCTQTCIGPARPASSGPFSFCLAFIAIKYFRPASWRSVAGSSQHSPIPDRKPLSGSNSPSPCPSADVRWGYRPLASGSPAGPVSVRQPRLWARTEGSCPGLELAAVPESMILQSAASLNAFGACHFWRCEGVAEL
jgi:hypothetical protein